MSQLPGYLSSRWPGQAPVAYRKKERRRGFWRRHRLLVLLLSPPVLLAVAGGVLWPIAAAYQPVGPGSSGGGSFPWLPTGVGLRWVNGFLVHTPDLYVPPQRAAFALSASIRNNGSYPVTIEAVIQQPRSPLRSAGPVLYFRPEDQNVQQQPGHILRDVTLKPGHEIDIGMPLLTWPCAVKYETADVRSFVVRVRFMSFTHLVAVPFIDGGQIVMNLPGGKSGEQNVFCANR